MLTKRLTLALWTLMAAPFYCAVVQPLAAAQLVVPFNYFWAYQDSGNDPGPDWFTPEFNHSSWKFGLSRFGYGNFNEQTEVNSAANTVYFRTTFSGTANTYSNLSLLLLRDDGAVVYLNGVEVLRNNLPEGPVIPETRALRSLDDFEEMEVVRRVIPSSLLRPEGNVLAVEVHQAEGGEDDLAFTALIIGHFIGENQPPSASASSVTTLADQPVAVLLNATDPENQPLQFHLLTFPANGFLTGDAPNLTYVPNPGFAGTDRFTFVASDGEWPTETVEVVIEVKLPSNRPPLAPDQALTVNEDGSLLINLNASDPDGDELAYSFTSTANGALTPQGANTLLYQPSLNYFGPDEFTFTVDDGNGGSATATITIDVMPVNDAPLAVAGVANPSTPEALAKSITLVAMNNQNAAVLLDGSQSSDVDNAVLNFAWFLNSNVNPFSSAAQVTVALPVGSHTVSLRVSDGALSSKDTVTVQVLKPSQLVAAIETALWSVSNRAELQQFLKNAAAKFDRGDLKGAIQMLEQFQKQVEKKLAPQNPAAAQELIAAAQDILDLARSSAR